MARCRVIRPFRRNGTAVSARATYCATTVRLCMAEGLVGGDGFAVDASMIKADANRQRSVPGSKWQAPETASQALREYLAVLDDAAFGAATPVVPKFISHADPASRWTGEKGVLAFFAYGINDPI